MKKIIAAFAAGQALQILLLYLSEQLTYSDRALGFCMGVGIIVLVALIVGAWGAWFAPAATMTHTDYAEALKHTKAPKAPDKAKLKQIFPQWQLDAVPVGEMDEVAELPKEIKVTNDGIVREEAQDV